MLGLDVERKRQKGFPADTLPFVVYKVPPFIFGQACPDPAKSRALLSAPPFYVCENLIFIWSIISNSEVLL